MAGVQGGPWIGRENPGNAVFGLRVVEGAVSVSHCVVVRTGLSSAHHGHSGRQPRIIERGGMRTNVIKDNSLKPPWQ